MQENGLRKEYTFCRICESLCGLEVTMNGNTVEKIMPDPEHVATRGFACPKGLKQQNMYQTRDRLKYPLERQGDTFQRVSWDQALKGIGDKVKRILKENGPDSIAMYVGTAAGFGVLHPMFAQGFMDGIGSKSMFASASQDCSNKFAVAERIYGFPFTQPFPDIHHTNCLIIVGANPVVSKWSFLQVPNPSLHLKEMERRGAKIFIVDPRRTETAKVAGEHVFIRPNTDAFFYLAFLNELEKQGGINKKIAGEHTTGIEEVLSLARKWPADRTAEVTQIPVETIRKMVRNYTQADGACMYSSTGVNMGSHGSIGFWIQETINALSGNLDRKGGTLVGKGVIDFPKFGKKNGILLRNDRSRIGNFHSTNDAFPGGILADEILTPGKRQIRALFVTGGNPLITMANSNRLREAFQKLDLLVTLDIYPNETGSIGHYMLPCTSPLERPDLPFIFPLMLGLQAKPYLQATKALVKPEGEQRDEASIYLDLCKASGVNLFGSVIAQRFMATAARLHGKKLGGKRTLPQEWILNLLMKVTRQPGFKRLLKSPHGVLRPDHKPGSFLGKRVLTENGKVQLAHPILMEEANKLELHFEREKAAKNTFKLITKRAVTTHNSWTHNYDDFVKGDRYTNFLYVHPKDAEKLGVEERELVDVSTETGKVRLPVKYLADLMPGTVALPHGWGHQHSNLETASKTQGVNVNILAADGPDRIERVSGMANLTGFPVHIEKSSDKLYPTWSGLKEDDLNVAKLSEKS